MSNLRTGLEEIFATVMRRMLQERDDLNHADALNTNHGDHMVEIFNAAAQAAGVSPNDLARAMEAASQKLAALPGNGSAQVYARGLAQFAREFARQGVSLDDLIRYIHNLLEDSGSPAAQKSEAQDKNNAVLKALLGGLNAWQQVEAGKEPSGKLAELGALFDLGIIYFQAKQRGGSRARVLADAAATASPLGQVPHRYQSGKLALQTLLEAMAQAQDKR